MIGLAPVCVGSKAVAPIKLNRESDRASEGQSTASELYVPCKHDLA